MAVSIRVPTRFRYRQRMTLELAVSNRGAASIDDVRVRIDSAYLDRFSNVTLTPPVGADGGVRLGALQAGQTARMTATLEGEDAGTHRGVAVVTDAAADTARVALASIVFP